jgi:hypothetical protein
VTIVLGTYLLFNAIFVWLMVALKRLPFAQRGLNGFTLSQLSFRIRNYTKDAINRRDVVRTVTRGDYRWNGLFINKSH